MSSRGFAILYNSGYNGGFRLSLYVEQYISGGIDEVIKLVDRIIEHLSVFVFFPTIILKFFF